MLSPAKFIGLLVAATTFIQIALGAAGPVAGHGFAHREVVDYANGLMADGMNIVGRQAASTVTVTLSDCGTSGQMSTTTVSVITTVSAITTVATTTAQITVHSTTAPVSGSAISSTTTAPVLSGPPDTISGSSEVSTGTDTTTAPPAPTSAPSTAPPATNSAASSSFTETSFSENSSITLPPSPTGSTTSPTTSSSTPTGGVAQFKFDVIGAVAAVGVAAFAVY